MLEFSEILISHKDLFFNHLTDYNPEASELNFTNIFMWRNYYSHLFTLDSGYLCLISKPKMREAFAYIPIGKYEKDSFLSIVLSLKEYFHHHNLQMKFSRISENEIKYFEETGLPINLISEPDQSDYVYLSSELISLNHNQLNYKRNLLRVFLEGNEYEYQNIQEGNLEECERINIEWGNHKTNGDYQLAFEHIANTEVLNNYNALGCTGGLIKVNGKFEAFTYGERLNKDTAVIHAEQANRNIKGLYNFINQKFCEQEWSSFPYINREQDLGVEGLRKAKNSYRPVKKIKKYSVIVQ